MRATDRPIPTSIVLDPGALATWPVRPVFALEQTATPPIVWDDATVWGDPAAVWDAPSITPIWADATCDFTGCQIEYDGPDDHGNYPAAHCILQLDNRSGKYARYNVDGTPRDFGAGRALWIWADEKAGPGAWWLFAGRIARWDERADDSIEIEAFDYISDIAQPVGTYTPGAAGDTPAVRLAAIMAAANTPTVRTRFATGTVHLSAQSTDRAPLEEMQTVVASDGGVLYGDADGTVVTTDRLWRNGRADQVARPVIATNVCTAPVIVTDPTISTSDDHLAGTAILENVAHLRATATNALSPGHTVFTEADQQWQTQAEGDALAAWIVGQQWQPRIALDAADIYLSDPAHPGYVAAIDWRRLDRIRLLHDSKTPTGPARVDVEVALVAITDQITPDGWLRSIATTRALTYIATTLWDQTALTWDDPAAVWGY